MLHCAFFDIDNTLLRNSSSHRQAFNSAIQKVYGLNTDIEKINPHGMTDQQIVYEALRINDVEEAVIQSRFTECMNAVSESFSVLVKKEKLTPLAGVEHLLNELYKFRVLLGIVTGNLKSIAALKLQIVGLDFYFKIGGYGSDHINRAELVKLAVLRAKKYSSQRFTGNVFLFGDTPRDISAGKEGGVKTVGVATGKYSVDELIQAGADITFSDLTDTRAVKNLFI